MAKLRVFEAFSGIGTQKMGLSRANIDHDVVDVLAAIFDKMFN